MIVSRDGAPIGIVAARDRLRPEAAGVLAELRGLGIESIALLTGDRLAPAQQIAGSLELTDVRAELAPQEKAAYIEEWRRIRRVAFVGDGINDAPALAKADVGIALAQSSSDLAAEAGDIVFLKNSVAALPFLIRLSREEKQRLQKIADAHSSPQARALRCRLILRCGQADRPTNAQVAQQFGCDPATVAANRQRIV